MNKPTPGPWTIRDDKYSKGIVSEMRFVVECNTNIPGVKNTVALVGYKPNARLISVAPDLLEACKLVRLKYEIYQKDSIRLGGKIGLYLSFDELGFLEQAIAKAQAK